MLDTEKSELPASLKDVQSFIEQYITTALWSSNDESTPGGGEPFDKSYSASDLADEARLAMEQDCVQFMRDNSDLLVDLDYSAAGQDFWLTRNGHGAGFWDGDYPENGDALTKASKVFGECDLYLGDDGLIYLYSG